MILGTRLLVARTPDVTEYLLHNSRREIIYETYSVSFVSFLSLSVLSLFQLFLYFSCLFIHIAPDGPPIKAQATDVQPTNITLSWQPPVPELRNGNIVRYSICLLVFNISSEPCLRRFRLRRKEYTVNELKPYTKYIFNISAGTTVGFGPHLSLIERTLQTGMSVISSNNFLAIARAVQVFYVIFAFKDQSITTRNVYDRSTYRSFQKIAVFFEI